VNVKNKIVSYAAVLVVAFSLIYAVRAGAVTGQRYFGDGATPDPAGGWSYTSASDSSCLVCHIPNNSTPDKSSYLMTGHRNALRKATVNSFWNGPDGLIYDTDSSGRGIFWNTPGPVPLGIAAARPPLLDGSCSLWGYLDQGACQSAGGTWTSTSNSLFYIFGGWINAIARTGAFNDPSSSIAAPGAVPSGGSYACARCHATGVTLDTAISTTRPPDKTYPGINGQVNFDPDGSGPATTVSWATGFNTGQALEGILCERCHDATRHFISGPTVPKGVTATALCLQCHRQEHTVTYTSGGRGANIHPTPFTDNSGIPLSEPTYSLPAIEVGRPDGSYGQQFFGYSTGMEFLNSVHARFTGNFQQVNAPAKYNSGFSYGSCDLDGYLYDQNGCESVAGSWTDAIGCTFTKPNCEVNAGIWTVLQGGCSTCHDVHNSLFAGGQAGKAIKVSCTDCHTGQTPGAGVAPQVTAANIRHPQSSGTPFDASRYRDVCVVCHMATQAVTNGDQVSTPAHLWRINTNATYTTWPSLDQFNGTNGHLVDKRATMVPETYTLADGISQATYTNAVWLDLDLVCGQCHGASGTAHLLNKQELTAYAGVMHNDGSAVPPTACTICHATPQNGKVAIKADFGPGKNHHGAVPGETDCIACHTRPGTLPAGWNSGGAMGVGSGTQFCLNCHQNYPTTGALTPGVSHHAGACVTCHNPNDTVGAGGVTGPGVIPVVSNCLTCHPTRSMGAGTNHKQSILSAPQKCQDCHIAGGFKPTAATCLAQCHGDITKAPNIEPAALSSYLVGMHVPKVPFVNHAPVALGLRDSYTGTTTLNATVVTNSSNSVAFTDRSTDADNNVKAVTVNWGDSTPVSSMSTTGGSFSHSYSNAGTFTIIHTVTDLSGAGNTERATIKVVPPAITVSGTVTNNAGKPLSMAKVTMKKGLTSRTAYTNVTGTYKFTKTLPGTWTITATKTGYTFSGSVTVNAPTGSVAPTITAN
jgi:hypothetical protein